jgi:hypothetical protein
MLNPIKLKLMIMTLHHVKRLIQTLKPDCELSDLLIKLWDFASKTIPNDPIKFLFKTYNPVQ